MTRPGIKNLAFINGKTGCVECHNCGAAEKLKLPATVDALVAQGNAFGAKHFNCEPRTLMVRKDPARSAPWRPGLFLGVAHE